MIRIILKILITALLVTGVSELGKRSTVIASILVALPVTTILALSWLYFDTRDIEKVSELSIWVFWAVLPSFLFLLSLPFLLRHGVRFIYAMPAACVIMFGGYTVYALILKNFGVKL
jgi:uncharacterized membrane protein (GlpM family)